MFLSHAQEKYNKFIKRHFILKNHTLPLLEKIGVVFLIMITIGLPINKLHFYILFIFSLIIITQNKPKSSTKNWLIAIALVFLINIASNFILPTLKIEEGFNYFVYNKRGEVLEKNLPPPIFHFMKKALRDEYPKQGECEDKDYCWGDAIKYKGPKEVFAFSGDAIWQQPKYSRIIDDISFNNQTELRIDVFNSEEVTWLDLWPKRSIIPRTFIPYFVMYEFPTEAIGGKLCWRGDLFWEIEKNVFKYFGYQNLDPNIAQCMKLPPKAIGKRIFGISISPQKKLSMQFAPNKNIKKYLLIKKIVKFTGVFLILLLLINIPFKRINLLAPTIFLIIGVSITSCSIMSLLHQLSSWGYQHLGYFSEYPTGSDALIYNNYAREIVKNLLKGDIVEALRGNEDVFYFMPGMRYFIAIGKIFFGDTNYGHILMLFTFILFLWKFIRYYLSLPISLLMFTIFFYTDQTIHSWFSFDFYLIYIVLSGFPGIVSYAFLLAGLFTIMTKFDKLKSFQWYGFWGSLSLALAIFVRPNLAFMILVFLSLLALHLIKKKRYLDLIYICIGFSFVILIPYHNWYFGKKFVPLTSAAFVKANYIVPISTYVKAFKELLSFNTSSPAIVTILNYSSAWIRNELYFIMFMLLILCILFKKILKNLPLIRFLALGLLVQHITLNIWQNDPRYSNIVWLLTFIVTLIMFYEFIKKNVFISSTRKV